MQESGDSRTVDTVLEALGSPRRRYALHHVRDNTEVTVEALATAVTDWLADVDGPAPAGPEGYEQVQVALHHRDLPKLEEAGLVSVDHDAGTVTVGESALGDALLDVLEEYERGLDPSGSDDAVYRGV